MDPVRSISHNSQVASSSGTPHDVESVLKKIESLQKICRKTGQKLTPMIFDECRRMAAEGYSDEDKLEVLKNFIRSESISVKMLYVATPSLIEVIELNEDSKLELRNFVIKVNCGIEVTSPHFIFFRDWLYRDLENLHASGDQEKFREHLCFCNKYQFDFMNSSLWISKIVKNAMSNNEPWILKFITTFLTEGNYKTTGGEFFRQYIEETDYSLEPLLGYLTTLEEEKSKEYRKNLAYIMNSYFPITCPYTKQESVAKRVDTFEKSLVKYGEFQVGNFPSLFKDSEVAEDFRTQGPISQCLKKCVAISRDPQNAQYVQYLQLFYQRISKEGTRAPAASSSSSQNTNEYPLDSHLYIHLGITLRGRRKPANVFMMRRPFDEGLGHFRHQNIREKEGRLNVVFKNAEIEPAIENSASEMNGKNAFNSPMLQRIGFRSLFLPGGSFITIPLLKDIEAGVNRELSAKCKKKGKPYTPFTIFPSEGIATDAEYVRIMQNYDVGVSMGFENIHDVTVHLLALIKMKKKNPEKYDKLRLALKTETQLMIAVCEFVQSSPAFAESPREHDLVKFIVRTASLIYDSGSSKTVLLWSQSLKRWKKGKYIGQVWRDGYNYWRRGMTTESKVPLEYSSQEIQSFWNSSLSNYTSCLSCREAILLSC